MLRVDALQVKVPISGRAHPVGQSEDGLTIKQCQSWPSLSQTATGLLFHLNRSPLLSGEVFQAFNYWAEMLSFNSLVSGFHCLLL